MEIFIADQQTEERSPVDQALVSVIIPVYNGERYLAEAIDSVLSQTYSSLEIVVIDDGSTDDSAGVVKRYGSKVRYFFQPHRGLSAALNHGVQAARGSFFSFLDADDVWMENKITQQMMMFANNPILDIVFGHVRQFCSPELNGNQKNRLQGFTELLPGYFKGTMLIKREAFSLAGIFDTVWKVGDFVDWYLKALESGLKSVMLPDVLMIRRVHTQNMGIREQAHQRDYVRILKASLDRRRKKGQI